MSQKPFADDFGDEGTLSPLSSKVLTILKEELLSGKNLADLLHNWDRESIDFKSRLPILIRTLLVDTFQYRFLSFNLPDIVPDIKTTFEQLNRLKDFNVVLAFTISTSDLELINPNNPEQIKITGVSYSRKLAVAYVKAKSEQNSDMEAQILEGIRIGLTKNQPADDSNLSKKNIAKADQLAQSVKSRRIKVTPQYGVSVTNELFHYGNVEAWYNIIESYHSTHPDTEVMIFHRGQRIYRIYSLFGWGKIKFGDAVFFAVAGNELKDVAKLKKYLSEAASPRFQPYIKKNVNAPLKLF